MSMARSTPFCAVSLVTIPMTGSRLGSHPQSAIRSRRAAAFPARSSASNGSARWASVDGFHSAVSMPLRMPTRASPLARSGPSRPNPPSGRRISWT